MSIQDTAEPTSVDLVNTVMWNAAKFAGSPYVARRVVRAAQIPRLTTAEFLRHSDARTTPDNVVLTLSVSDRRRGRAVRLTNVYTQQFVKVMNARPNGPLKLQAVVMEPAQAGTASSFRPHALRNGLVGGAIGALVGTALVLGIATRRKED
jgi:capsular polysaccharide biosynthesis protein